MNTQKIKPKLEHNVIAGEEFKEAVDVVLTDLLNVLADHCGPYKGTAILTNPENPLAEPVFTKDGINIVDSIRYKNPVYDFIRQQISYMGSRVDRGAGDGTTSTMILMAAMIRYLFTVKEVADYSAAELLSIWNELVDRIAAHYKPYIDRVKKISDRKLIRYIAGCQAYTSSHGDLELVKCIEELFANSPKEVWDTLTAQRAVYESDKKYNLIVNNAEYTLDNVSIFPRTGNQEFGTRHRYDNIDCLLWYHLNLGDDTQKPLIDFIDERIKSTDAEPLAVMCCNDLDNVTMSHFYNLFAEHKNCKVVFITVPFADMSVNDIQALEAMLVATKKIINARERLETNHLTDTVKLTLECKNDKCRIVSGIFNKRFTGINPLYKKKEYPGYNKFIENIKIILKKEKEDITRKNNKQIIAFTRILHKLISTKDVSFIIGGAAYDNAAGRDVAMDSLLATKCSLTQGFVAGRFVTLNHVVGAVYTYTLAMDDKKKQQLFTIFLHALMVGINKVNDSLGVLDGKGVLHGDSPVDVTRLNDPSYAIPADLETALKERKDYCIIQPAMTDITFLKRFGELGLKFLTANSTIAAGRQWDIEHKEDRYG